MNPCNVLSIMGDVFSDIRPLTNTETGEVYGVFFHIRVPRAFRNADGNYDYDVLPVQYHTSTDAVQKFALQLHHGDGVSVVGTVQVSQGNFIVITDSVSLTMASAHRLHNIAEDDVTAAEDIANDDHKEEETKVVKQLPLPF